MRAKLIGLVSALNKTGIKSYFIPALPERGKTFDVIASNANPILFGWFCYEHDFSLAELPVKQKPHRFEKATMYYFPEEK